jgi:hypothetical protein
MKSVRIAPAVRTHGRGRRGVLLAPVKPAPRLLGTLEAQVRGTDHQDDREQPRHELTEQQRRRQDEHQLVAQGSDRDPLDHRQFAIGGDAVDVLGCHRGVVDDDACRLGGRSPGSGADVVDRCGRKPGKRGNVVEKSEQTSAHRVSVMATNLPGTATPHEPHQHVLGAAVLHPIHP